MPGAAVYLCVVGDEVEDYCPERQRRARPFLATRVRILRFAQYDRYAGTTGAWVITVD